MTGRFRIIPHDLNQFRVEELVQTTVYRTRTEGNWLFNRQVRKEEVIEEWKSMTSTLNKDLKDVLRHTFDRYESPTDFPSINTAKKHIDQTLEDRDGKSARERAVEKRLRETPPIEYP